VSVRGRAHARVDKRIGTLYSELRARKSKHVLRQSRPRQKRSGSKSVPKHGECWCVSLSNGQRLLSAVGGLLVLEADYQLALSASIWDRRQFVSAMGSSNRLGYCRNVNIMDECDLLFRVIGSWR
jgi:hypothetical protein